MRVSTNVSSMAAQRYVRQHTEELSLEENKLSSGSRIVKSAIDPAGLAIAERMRAKLRSNYQAERNSNDSISLLQVAEGSLGTLQDMGVRLRELSLQAANDTVTDDQRFIIDAEFQQLKNEVERLTLSTSFNGNNLIKSDGSVYDLQIGINGLDSEDRITYDMAKVMDSKNNFGISNVSLKTKIGAQNSLGKLDHMMGQISASRAQLGSMGNRMTSIIQNLQVSRENMATSESKIRDADVASEAALSIKSKLMQSASIEMLRNANNAPNTVLKLVS